MNLVDAVRLAFVAVSLILNVVSVFHVFRCISMMKSPYRNVTDILNLYMALVVELIAVLSFFYMWNMK